MSGSQNALGPQAPEPAAPGPQLNVPQAEAGAAPSAPDLRPKNHAAALELFKHTQEMLHAADAQRKEFDLANAMGANVTPEHIVEAAGRLVGAGHTAKGVAATLASMPNQAGQSLQSWVQAQDNKAKQVEQQIAQAHSMAGHWLANSSFQQMQQLSQQSGAAPLTANHLMGAPQNA